MPVRTVDQDIKKFLPLTSSSSLCRRHDRLFGQRVLLPSDLCGTHHVPGIQRPCRGAAAETAAFGDSVLLPARQVPDRGELGAVVRPPGRVQRKVSVSFRVPWHSVYYDSITITTTNS